MTVGQFVRDARVKAGGILGAGLLVGTIVAGAPAAAATNGQRIAALESAVAQLQARVTALEGPRPSPTATAGPTVGPTSGPSGSPTVAPTPASTSGPRPFAAPVTSSTYTVPSTIDGTGATDVASSLNAYVASVPDGSVISFPAGKTYRMNRGLILAGRNNIVLKGNGATLAMKGPAGEQDSTALLLRGSNNVAIENFTVIGNNPNTTTIFGGGENSHAFATGGWYGGPASSFVEVSRVTARNLYGDFAYLEGRNIAPVKEPSHHVWIHHNDGQFIGRNAISSINVNDLLVEDNKFDKIGMDAWDIEPNFDWEQVRRNTFRRNTIGSYGHMTQFLGWFVNSWNPSGKTPIDGIIATDNTVGGNPSGGYDGTPRGLNVRFSLASVSGQVRARNVEITNNRTTQPAIGPVLFFSNVDGVRVAGNVQPLVSGSLTGFSSCTGVVTT